MSRAHVPKFLRSTKYIDMDSSYRNRTDYPNPAAFVTRTTSSGASGNTTSIGLEAQDPVVDAYPVLRFKGNVVGHKGVIQGGITSAPELDPLASTTRNFYQGAVMCILSPQRGSARIAGYQPSLRIATLDTALAGAVKGARYAIIDPSNSLSIFMPDTIIWYNAMSGLYLYDTTIEEAREIVIFDPVANMFILKEPFSDRWAVTDTYDVRHSPYIVSVFKDEQIENLTYKTLSVNHFQGTVHEGMYVRIVNDTMNPPLDAAVRITEVDRNANTVTFSPPLQTNVDTSTTRIEILLFSRDNSAPLNINSTCLFDTGYYEVELKFLILPNVTLATTQGGRLPHYPYVYVEFGNVSSEPRHILISNNPHSTRAVFKCHITDVQLPVTSAFLKLYLPMRHVMLLNPYDSLALTIRMPNGEVFKTTLEDNFSPKPVNPYVQVNATFSITRVDGIY